MPALAENRYGKSRVRVVRVRRHADRHELREWSVQVLLQGDFESCFTVGDNSKILPTDTMKNTVYSLARKSSADTIEVFAGELVEFFLSRNPQVSAAEVSICEKLWDRISANGKPHPAAFVQSAPELQTTTATRAQSGKLSLVSGLEDLVILNRRIGLYRLYKGRAHHASRNHRPPLWHVRLRALDLQFHSLQLLRAPYKNSRNSSHRLRQSQERIRSADALCHGRRRSCRGAPD